MSIGGRVWGFLTALGITSAPSQNTEDVPEEQDELGGDDPGEEEGGDVGLDEDASEQELRDERKQFTSKSKKKRKNRKKKRTPTGSPETTGPSETTGKGTTGTPPVTSEKPPTGEPKGPPEKSESPPKSETETTTQKKVATYSIRGQVNVPEGLLQDIELQLTGGATATQKLRGGAYSFDDLPANKDYQVTARCGGVVFTPPTQVIKKLSQDEEGRDFASKPAKLTVTFQPAGGISALDFKHLMSSITVDVTGTVERTGVAFNEAGEALVEDLLVGDSCTVTLSPGLLKPDTLSQSLSNLEEKGSCEFTFPTCQVSGRFEGFVPERDTGVAVVIDYAGQILLESPTSATGTFTFANLPAGLTYIVRSKPEDKDFNPRSQPITPESDSELGKPFRFRGYTLTGTVWESQQSKQGLVGATVTIEHGAFRVEVQTKEKGHYELPGGMRLRKGLAYDLSVTPPTGKSKYEFVSSAGNQPGPWTIPEPTADKTEFSVRRLLPSESNPEKALENWGLKIDEFIVKLGELPMVKSGAIVADAVAARKVFTDANSKITGVGVVAKQFKICADLALAPVRTAAIEQVRKITTSDEFKRMYKTDQNKHIEKQREILNKANLDTLHNYSFEKYRKELLEALRADESYFPTITPGATDGGMTDLTEVGKKLSDGGMKASDVMKLIPSTVTDSWHGSTTRFKSGFEYEWTDENGVQYHVHGHTRDHNHTTGNSGTGSVVRIRIGMNWLKSDGTTTTNICSDMAHIPLYG